MSSILHKKYNLLAIASISLIFFVLITADFYYSWQGYKAQLVRDAQNGSIYAEETVGQIVTILDALSKSPALKSGDTKKISEYLNNIGDFPQITTFALANPKGFRWAGKRTDIGVFSVADTEFFLRTVRTGKPYITGANKSKLINQIEFVVSYPIFNQNNQLENVFYAPVLSSQLSNLLTKTKLQSGGHLHIVDEKGHLLLYDKQAPKELKLYNPGKQFPTSSNNLFAFLTIPNGKLTATERIEGTPWFIVVDEDISHVITKVLENVLFHMLGIILILLPVIIVFMLFIAQINRQRKDLLRSNKKLQNLATTDGLTGLLNHRAFQDTLSDCLRDAGPDHPLTLLLMDIDNFKIFNDQYGHQAGDVVLKSLGKIMKDFFKGMGFVARYGGEEFVVILIDTPHEKGLAIAQQLSAMLQSTSIKISKEDDVIISMSIGTATYPKDARDRENLIKFADRALYKAKEHESNKVQMYYSVLEELRGNIQGDQDLMKIIHTLNTIINTKDKYTYGHSERVMNYAVKLAGHMGLPKKDIESITIGAFLHDIGKVEIAGDILNKPGKLNLEEFEWIKKHPLIGAEIIKPIKSLEKARDFALYHHERYDGSGYPFGLHSTDIPLFGRIGAIVDAFDAMTTNRPYQKVRSQDEALQELVKCAGTQFDPEIVKKFVELCQEHDLLDEDCDTSNSDWP